MAEIEWTQESEERLQTIHDYIAADNPSAASRVVVQIYEKVQLLREHPRLGQRYEPITEREVREKLFFGHYRIPYDLVFLVTTLGEIPNRGATLQRSFRALKPAGVLSVTSVVNDVLSLFSRVSG